MNQRHMNMPDCISGRGRDMGRGPMRYMSMDRSLNHRSGCGCSACESNHRGGSGRNDEWKLRLDNSGVQGQTGGGCCLCKPDCNDNVNELSCKSLLEKLRMLDFALCELVLYLDAYPHACDALEMYHRLVAERQEVLSLYESACGPLTAGGNQSHSSWDWFKGPFPWDYEAN
jgi:spore coat protein JB